MPLRRVSPSCVDLRQRVTARQARALAREPDLRIVQFAAPLAPESFDHLERHLFSARPEVALRAYGHYGGVCDLSFLARTPSVTRFHADCLREAAGLEHLAELPRLTELSLGVTGLTSLAILERVPAGLTRLAIGETRSRRPDLALLARFRDLRRLHVSGHTRGLAVVGDLPGVENLDLHRLRGPDLSFLGGMPALRELSVCLGGSDDLSAIGKATGLTLLELDWIRRISDLSFVSRLALLETLRLRRLAQVRALPDLRPLASLTDLELMKLTGLRSVAPVAGAPALKRLLFIDAANFTPTQMAPVLDAPRLEEARVGFGSERRNREFAERAEARGIRHLRS